MGPLIGDLLRGNSPLSRWKLFQVLALEGENMGNGGELRDVRGLLITDKQFTSYVDRARSGLRDAALARGIPHSCYESVLKVEDNATMQSSYVLVDEFGRFLDCSSGGKTPTEPILKVGVEEAFRQLSSGPGGGFNAEAFARRDGDFYKKQGGGSPSANKANAINLPPKCASSVE